MIKTLSALLLMTVAATAQVDNRELVLAEVAKENSVVETMWGGLNTLRVTMRDDGSKRDGFAEYLCMVLSDYDLRTGKRVVVYDAYAMARGEWKQIGENWC